MINTTGMIAAVLGFGISGLIVERWGARTGFYLDSASFLISATCIFLIIKKIKARSMDISVVGKEIVKAIRRSSVFTEIKEGICLLSENQSHPVNRRAYFSFMVSPWSRVCGYNCICPKNASFSNQGPWISDYVLGYSASFLGHFCMAGSEIRFQV